MTAAALQSLSPDHRQPADAIPADGAASRPCPFADPAFWEFLGAAIRQAAATVAAAPAEVRHAPEDVLRTADMARELNVDPRSLQMMKRRADYLKPISKDTWLYQQVILWKAHRAGMPLEEANAEWERYRASLKRKARLEQPADGKRRG